MNNISRVFSFCLITLLCVAHFNVKAAGEKVLPFDAVYDMYRQGDKLGQGNRSLKALGNNKFTLELNSKIEWLIFSDTRKEVSLFHYEGDTVTPISYNYDRKGTGKDKKLNVEFKPDGALIIEPKAKKKPAPDTWQKGWHDEMSLHMQVQVDLMAGKETFEYDMVSNSGKLKKYKFEVIGNEIISTGMGRFNAIKVARVYDKKKFYAQHAWFIPELNYTLARLWRMKKGVEQYDLVINQYQTN